jgi:hypothetical protein
MWIKSALEIRTASPQENLILINICPVGYEPYVTSTIFV